MSSVIESESDEENRLKKIIKLLKEKHFQTTKSKDKISFEEKLGEILEWFISFYQQECQFLNHHQQQFFQQIFVEILNQNLYLIKIEDNNSVKMIWCLRILFRDQFFQDLLMKDLSTLQNLIDFFQIKTSEYLQLKNEGKLLDHLSRIFQKISTQKIYHSVLLKKSVHKIMIKLLRASDVTILHCSLIFLIALADSKQLQEDFCNDHVTDFIMQIIQEFDDSSKQHAANLLRLLSSNPNIREQIFIYDSLPILLSILNDCEQCELLWHVTWTLTRLCSDPETTNEIRLLGGIPLLLNLLHKERSLTCRRSDLSSGGVQRSNFRLTSMHKRGGAVKSRSECELLNARLQLSSAVCTAIAELSIDERCAQSIVQNNGVYIIAQLIIPQPHPDKCQQAAFDLQINSIRALRFLFSLERNRKIFKMLFKPKMFQQFIDIGHFIRDSSVYRPLVENLNIFTSAEVDELKSEIVELNCNKIPKRYISHFAIYDVIGSGAFGCVYRVSNKVINTLLVMETIQVKRRSSERALALKELNISTVGSGNKSKEIAEIVRELSIIREQLRHPNVVRYLSTFQENDKLYIEMELIEGASLQEHFTSLKEKKEKGMNEDRIWKIFIQMCLALRYLHIDKKIVHRDLTANNVMLSENDKVTITDFGLAKHKRDKSEMTSAVGTILYWCPEIIKSEPYSEKADIWALGCLLFQMATLEVPFNASNMLTLAKKIVEGSFERISSERGYSNLVSITVDRCLTTDSNKRPNILEVCGVIASQMMTFTDQLENERIKIEKKLEKERRRTQRHFHEALRNKLDYQTLFQASQDHVGRLNLRANSRSNSDEVFVLDDEKMNKIRSQKTQNLEFTVWDGSGSSSNKEIESGASSARSRPGLKISFRTFFRLFIFSVSSASSSRILSISPNKVREIDDPVTKTLMQLHKIIYIDQLPPTTMINFRRRIISKYKRILFTPSHRSDSLKMEMKKLLNGSHDVIDVSFIFDAKNLNRKTSEESLKKSSFYEEEITYSQMQMMIERVLQESGYYEVKSASKINYS